MVGGGFGLMGGADMRVGKAAAVMVDVRSIVDRRICDCLMF
jgi:hypothetical protein